MLAELFTPVSSGALTAKSRHLPGSALQAPQLSTQRLSAVLITPRTLRWAGLGSAPCVHGPLWPAATPWLPCSPLTENEAPLLSRLSSRPSPVTGFPGCQPLLSSVRPLGSQVPHYLFRFRLSFVLPGEAGTFPVLLGVQGPLLVFTWAL